MFTVYFRFAATIPADPERAALLEQLLARAEPKVAMPDWRADALGIIAPEAASLSPASAALAACGAAVHAGVGRESGEWVFIATPVHLVAGLRGVNMPPDGILELDESEREALIVGFNRVFGGGGIRLHAGRDRLLLCTVPKPLRAATRAPEELAGQEIWDYMPHGPDAGEVRRLMTEAQMWLHEHAINERRGARAAPLISGLWLWGGGSTRVHLPAIRGWAAGKDPLFGALAVQAHYPGAVGSGVVVVAHAPGSPGWRDIEERWLAPASADLKAGRLQRLLLSAADRRYGVSTRGARRFWRRPRPWWEYFREALEPRAAGSS